MNYPSVQPRAAFHWTVNEGNHILTCARDSYIISCITVIRCVWPGPAASHELLFTLDEIHHYTFHFCPNLSLHLFNHVN